MLDKRVDGSNAFDEFEILHIFRDNIWDLFTEHEGGQLTVKIALPRRT